ncbi:MAG: M23 family metallopeptidase, partial [Flavobacteriales bacterium]
MIKCFFFFFVFFCATLTINAQKAIKPNYHPPLKIPLILASNFGELRPNHFHMGIDIKTKGKTGFRLYSIEDGFVSRIKVSPFGYGNVIYIDHPNGITSVYAHCLEFNEAIDSIVKSFQSKSEKFEVDLHFLKGDIPLKRGQIIGFSGNSGGSTAPHLHFELRNTESEHALNPLLFGFDIEDHQRPEIRGVKVYGLTKDGYRIKNRSLKRVVEPGKTT